MNRLNSNVNFFNNGSSSGPGGNNPTPGGNGSDASVMSESQESRDRKRRWRIMSFFNILNEYTGNSTYRLNYPSTNYFIPNGKINDSAGNRDHLLNSPFLCSDSNVNFTLNGRMIIYYIDRYGHWLFIDNDPFGYKTARLLRYGLDQCELGQIYMERKNNKFIIWAVKLQNVNGLAFSNDRNHHWVSIPNIFQPGEILYNTNKFPVRPDYNNPNNVLVRGNKIVWQHEFV